LLCHIRRGSGAAGWIEYEIASIGRHEDATLDNSRVRLHNVNFGIGEPARSEIEPKIIDRNVSKILKAPPITKRVSDRKKPRRFL
jgi:hypothetical protein